MCVKSDEDPCKCSAFKQNDGSEFADMFDLTLKDHGAWTVEGDETQVLCTVSNEQPVLAGFDVNEDGDGLPRTGRFFPPGTIDQP